MAQAIQHARGVELEISTTEWRVSDVVLEHLMRIPLHRAVLIVRRAKLRTLERVFVFPAMSEHLLRFQRALRAMTAKQGPMLLPLDWPNVLIVRWVRSQRQRLRSALRAPWGGLTTRLGRMVVISVSPEHTRLLPALLIASTARLERSLTMKRLSAPRVREESLVPQLEAQAVLFARKVFMLR